jgi:16S rRNA (cytosine967-C5)-methyltransferase
MRSHSYLNSAVKIINEYTGGEPLSSFLKKYFSANKKFGSRDRKQVTHLCYCFFRLGKALPKVETEARILVGLFLCSIEPNAILQELKPEWNSQVAQTIAEKLSVIHAPLPIKEVFPWIDELGGRINHEKFCESFLVQPNFYLRIRPGHEKSVKHKLTKSAISFGEIEGDCLSLSSATRIEDVIELDKEAVVQDLSSQQIGKYLELPIANCPLPIAAWDCCAGSGGKSVLLYDLERNIELTVSDVRKTVLDNLRKRFSKAGIKRYDWFVADLADTNSQFTIHNSPFTIHHSPFDLIICDAPCTGSGTWSRTPEQLYFFDEKKIDYYGMLQKRIVENVIPHLKRGGFFVYITCSVFRKENEDIVEFVEQKSHLQLLEMKLLNGYEDRADSMFVSVFRKGL